MKRNDDIRIEKSTNCLGTKALTHTASGRKKKNVSADDQPAIAVEMLVAIAGRRWRMA